MKLIFAIGNPGEKYNYTYHSLGLLLADFIMNKIEPLSIKEEATFELARYEKFFLVKSKVFMNNSSKAFLLVKNFYKFEKILVLHDELGLKKYKIKMKYSQGNAGHNGLRDLAQHAEFDRLQIGIDHPKNFNPNMTVHDYVLSNCGALSEWEWCFQNAFIAIQQWIES